MRGAGIIQALIYVRLSPKEMLTESQSSTDFLRVRVPEPTARQASG